MSSSDPRQAFVQRRHRALSRAGVTLFAVGTAVAIWAVAVHVLDVDVRSPAMGETPASEVTAAQVAVASLAAALAGWGLLATLERLTRRPRLIWTAIAGVVLLLSLGAPLSGEGIGAGSQTVLALLHLAVGAVLIPGMLHPTRPARSSTEATGEQQDLP